MLQELYKFVEGEQEWRYTSADVRVFHSATAQWYYPLAIERNAIEAKSNLAKSSLELKVPLTSEIGSRWIKGILQRSVSLTVFAKDDAATTVIWKGRLLQPSADTTTTKLRFESIYTSLKRSGIRRLYMRTCPYILYGRGCRLSKPAFEKLVVCTSVAAETLVIPDASGEADGYYIGGIVETISGSQRAIRDHAGTSIVMTRELEDLSEQFGKFGAQLLFIYPGCDRSLSTCDSKFSNKENFGGFPHIPTKSSKMGTFR